MKMFVIAGAVACSALLGLSAQAAPAASGVATLQNQVGSNAEKVWHCRAWSGGWGCGRGYYGHSRYWSHRRYGSWH